MRSIQRICGTLAALAGFASVLAAAHAAHGAMDPQAREFLRTGADIGLKQALAVFAALFLAARDSRAAEVAGVLFVVGILLFCGSLWAIALGAPAGVAMATPVGGVSFLAGWLVLAWACLTLRKPA